MGLEGAIEGQRALLSREIAWLFTCLRIAPGGSVESMTRFMANSILFVLRPAESALRRLLVIEARKLAGTITLRAVSKPVEKTAAARRRGARPPRVPLFRLFDKPVQVRKEPEPQKKLPVEPRITVLNIGMSAIEHHIWKQQQKPLPKPKRAPMPPRNAPPNAARLCRRLQAISHALDTIPKQADRMARALLRREAREPKERGDGPLRHGHPPGHRQRARHAIDHILRDCVALEREAAREAFDTS